jgi:hypothetical protein
MGSFQENAPKSGGQKTAARTFYSANVGMQLQELRCRMILAFLLENWGTLLVGAALFGVLAAVIVTLARDKRRGGQGGCGCGCGDCPQAPSCGRK